MSLRRALDGLPGDRVTESAVRQILEIMRLHPGETMDVVDVARRLERSEHDVSVVLLHLADASVLRRDGLGYRYERDRLLDLEVDRFMHRVQSHSVYVQSNVAKFRERFPGR